jgi:multidrug efflux pump subunit AcrA (membrane-fusion protein)
VLNQASGAFTKLPSAGQVLACGQVLYRVDDSPVVLLCGSTPAYRSLSEGDSGPDVKELNANLVHLGSATRSQLDPLSDYFSSETAYALEQLQAKLGVDQTGAVGLGQAVFLPGPLRISKTTAALGSMARPGAPVAEATSTRRQVEVDLNASQQTGVKVGEEAQVTLPDNQITPGTVTRIGTIASSSGSGQGSSSSGSNNTTIPVYVTLKHPKAAGDLDQAPVQVQIKTAGVKDAVIVPVNALLAQAGGGYAVETVDSSGAHHLVPVTVGLFDDADGLVQVTGALNAGARVVVPST